MLQILMSDLASVQSIHQNLCTNEKNSFINLHKNCLHVTLKAKFKPFKVNSVYLNVYYIRMFMKINSLISPGIFQWTSDIIYTCADLAKFCTIVSNLCYRTIKGHRYSIECQKPNWLFKKRNAGSKQDQSNISCKNQNFNVLTIISYYYVY